MDHLIKIIDRIKEFKNLQSDTAVAKALGISQSTFAERKKRGTIPYSELINFADKEHLNLDWLLTGMGPVLRGYAEELYKSLDRLDHIDKKIAAERERVTFINVYSLAGAGGPKTG